MTDRPYIPALALVPANLPPMARARHVLQRTSDAGFKWPNIQLVMAKVNEEVSEVEDAVRENNPQHVREEIGDALHAIVNLARYGDIPLNDDVLSLSDDGDYASIDAAFTAVKEHLGHADSAINAQQQARASEHLSDALLAIAYIAKAQQIDPEACLRDANAKFEACFQLTERKAVARGADMKALPIKDILALWKEAQREIREGVNIGRPGH